MRRAILVGSLTVALSALPAAAGQRGGVHVSSGSHPHVARHFSHFNHFHRFTGFGFNDFNGFNGFNTFGFNGVNRFGRSRFFAPFGTNWAWGWGLADWDNWDGWPAAGGAPGAVIILAGAPPAQSPPPPPAKATVSTEAGVTVIRGPGSHHLARY